MFCTGILCYGQAVIRCYAVVTAFYGNTSGICRSIVDSQDLIPGQAESRPGSTEGNRYIFFFIRIPVVVIISAENGCDSLVSSGRGMFPAVVLICKVCRVVAEDCCTGRM